MTTSSREAELPEKAVSEKASRASAAATSWSRLKDPRIVRVSRAFGGKDRHSKVCTVRGLRDRRVRLSVPTAIQLYDLQDRLGLNQPSKVVDWLLNVAKHEIDELPPLQIPPHGILMQNVPLTTSSNRMASPTRLDKLEGIKFGSCVNWEENVDMSRSNYGNWHKSKEQEKGWVKRSEEDGKQQGGVEANNSPFASSCDLVPRASNLLLNNFASNNSFHRWGPSNLSLSQFGSNPLAPTMDEAPNFNVVPLPSSAFSSIPSGSQVLVYPLQTQSYFPSNSIESGEIDSKQINFQMLSSSSAPQHHLPSSLGPPSLYALSQGLRPFDLSASHKHFFPQQSHRENESNEGN